MINYLGGRSMKYGMKSENSGVSFRSSVPVPTGVWSGRMSGLNCVTHYRHISCLLPGGKTTAPIRWFRHSEYSDIITPDQKSEGLIRASGPEPGVGW